ncbi:MAG: FHA domain-containing protein [Desulfobacterales bacterium]
MPKLTLMFQEKTLGEYDCEKEKSITIGRHADNDIVIDNLGASGHHAKIDYLNDVLLLTDLGSTNGTFVNEKLVASHKLRKDDVIAIAKHTLVVTYGDGEVEPEEAASLMDKTMVMDTEQHRALMEKSGGAGTGKAEEKGAMLTFLSGREGEMEISKKLTKIGKDPGSDIVVSGFTVGKTAATISMRPNGYFLSYVEGMSKPKVNGEAVKQSVKLNEFDIIEIGSVKAELTFT